jgi:hypothetical protein
MFADFLTPKFSNIPLILTRGQRLTVTKRSISDLTMDQYLKFEISIEKYSLKIVSISQMKTWLKQVIKKYIKSVTKSTF